MIAVIVFAGLCVGLETDAKLSPGLAAAMSLMNQYFFKYIFLLELVISIVAEGLQPWNFFKDNWHVFDFTVVVVLLIPLNVGNSLLVWRLLRILRVLKIMTALPVRCSGLSLLLW